MPFAVQQWPSARGALNLGTFIEFNGAVAHAADSDN
jgi:hypothetical protein